MVNKGRQKYKCTWKKSNTWLRCVRARNKELQPKQGKAKEEKARGFPFAAPERCGLSKLELRRDGGCLGLVLHVVLHPSLRRCIPSTQPISFPLAINRCVLGIWERPGRNRLRSNKGGIPVGFGFDGRIQQYRYTLRMC